MLKKLRSPFTALCLALFIIGVSLGYHGYSHAIFLDSVGVDFKPTWGALRGVRSDDWLVNFSTQLSLAHVEPRYPTVNPVIANGQNLSIQPFSPTHNMWFAFKPWLWGFELGVDTGVSWLWCFSAIALLLSAYFAASQVFKLGRWESVGLAVAFYFSTFIQFWAMASSLHLAFFFALLSLLYKLPVLQKRRLVLIACFGIAYFSMAWVFLFYPPFMGPLIFLLVCFVVNQIVQLWRDSGRVPATSYLKCLVIAGSTFFLLLAGFYHQTRDVIHAIMHTSYPGGRLITGGDMSILKFWGNTFFSVRHAFPTALAENISEAGGFIHWLPIMAPLIFLSRKSLDKKLWIPFLVVFAFELIFLFVGVPGIIAKLTLFSFSIVQRTAALIGVLHFFAIALWLKADSESKRTASWVKGISLTMLPVLGIWLNTQNFDSRSTTPGFAFTALTTVIFALFVYNHKKLALGLYVVLSFIGTSYFNPVSLRGMETALDSSTTVKIIRSIVAETPGKSWMVLNDGVWSNLMRSLAIKSYGGIHFYPDRALWGLLDPKYEYVGLWNRYAHVNFMIDPAAKDIKLKLTGGDALTVLFGPDSGLYQKLNTGVVLAKCFGFGRQIKSKRVVPIAREMCAHIL